jgi:hypothetical protein
MKIKGWEKISGYTYKGYCIVNPIHDANEEGYFATVLNLNNQQRPKWDIELTLNNNTGVIRFRILDSVTQHLLAKSHLTKSNIETLQQFREQYEMLVDDILEERQHYVKNVTRNINGGTTGIIGSVMNTGTPVTYSIAPQSSSVGLPKSGSLSHQSIITQLTQQLKELQEEMDKLNLDANNKKL